MEDNNYYTQVDETVSTIPFWLLKESYDEGKIELAKRLARECLINDCNWTKELKLKYCISMFDKTRMGKSTFLNCLISSLVDSDAYVFPTQENEDDSTFDHTFIRTFLSYMKTKDEENFKKIIIEIQNSILEKPKSVPLLIWNNYSPIEEYIIEEVLFEIYQHICILNNSVFIQGLTFDQKIVWGPWIYYIHGPLIRSKKFLVAQ